MQCWVSPRATSPREAGVKTTVSPHTSSVKQCPPSLPAALFSIAPSLPPLGFPYRERQGGRVSVESRLILRSPRCGVRAIVVHPGARVLRHLFRVTFGRTRAQAYRLRSVSIDISSRISPDRRHAQQDQRQPCWQQFEYEDEYEPPAAALGSAAVCPLPRLPSRPRVAKFERAPY